VINIERFLIKSMRFKIETFIFASKNSFRLNFYADSRLATRTWISEHCFSENKTISFIVALSFCLACCF